MSKLPHNWILTSLGEICSKPQYGWTSSSLEKGTIKIDAFANQINKLSKSVQKPKMIGTQNEPKK